MDASRRWRTHPAPARVLGDLCAAAVVLLAGGLPTHPRAGPEWTPEVLTLDALAAVVLLARHRFPLPVLSVLVAAVAVSVPTDLFNSGTVVAVAIATYSVALASDRLRAVVVTVVVALAVTVASLCVGEAVPQHPLVVLLGGALGEAIRTQRANLAAITERAERAERTREALARQRVAEDRLAIARDLHDVVAHQIAVINLHAGVATSALRTRPDEAQASLVIVRSSSRTVLTEIGDLLATLRDPDALDAGPPGLAQLDDVVRELAGHGLDVTVRTDGQPYDLPPTTDVTALRVTQEALTNAHKHGTGGRAHVLLEYLPRSLRITVTNPAASREPAHDPLGTRHGLLGTAERVGSVRGTLAHGPDGSGGWLLVAELPAGAGEPTADARP